MRDLQVSYRRSTSTHLSLHVPLDAAVNRDAVESYKERQVGVAVSSISSQVRLGDAVELVNQLLTCSPLPHPRPNARS